MNQVGNEPSILLVQNESETRMHRVLYLVRFTRAFMVSSVWTMTALALGLFFGVHGLSPGVDQTILTEARAKLSQITLTDFLTLAIPLYMCISIARVFRKSLKTLSLFWLFVGVMLFLTIPTQFKFSDLSIPFTDLFVLEIVFAGWVAIDTSVGLWKVSRTPEVSGFHAILDLRLTRGVWGLVNKLLDLPRTPLRNWGAFGGYLLALAGAIGFAMSLSYALALGGVAYEYGQLATNCGAFSNDQCNDQSKSWVAWFLVWFVLSIVGIKLSLTAQSSAKKFGALSADDILGIPGEKYILYLRSFGTDDVRLPRPRLPLLSWLMAPWPFPTRVEEELFDVADGYLPLIAIGRPGNSPQEAGGLAYREYVSDDDWHAYIEDKIQRAERIVMLLNTTHGVLWELNRVLALGAGPKTLFLFDPKARDAEAWRSIRDAIVANFIRAGLMPPMFTFLGQAIAFYFMGGKVVEIENSNWSVSSYRTAFSYFLAERA